jgi:hypothetical protein
MAAKLVDYIRQYDNVVDESLCTRIINQFNDSDFIRIDQDKRPSFYELNISKLYLDKVPEWRDVQESLSKTFIGVVENYMNSLDIAVDFPDKYAFEEFRAKMYRNNGCDEFADHVDVGNYNSARRFLVLFLYLNDVVDGGDTNFPVLQHSVQPKRGSILVFPPTWQYRHAGRPPISDKKYILGTYLHYV